MEWLLFLIVMILSILVEQLYQFIKSKGQLVYFRDTLHPVYSEGELNDVRKEIQKAHKLYFTYHDSHSDEISQITDKRSKDKSYKFTEHEEAVLKENVELSLKLKKYQEAHNSMIETNIGVLNGSIKRDLEEADEVEIYPFVSSKDVDKQYKEWLDRISK